MRDIEFWLAHIKDSTGFTELHIQLRALRFAHTYRLGNVLNIGYTLWEKFNELPHDDVKSRYLL